MKNLKKLSREDLKIVNGGIADCTYNVVGAWKPMNCPCRKGYHDCGDGKCVPLTQTCS